MTLVWMSNTHFPGAPQMPRDKLPFPTELGHNCPQFPLSPAITLWRAAQSPRHSSRTQHRFWHRP